MTEFTMDRLRENLEALKMKNTLEILDNYLERAVTENLSIVDILDHIFAEEAKSKWKRAYEKQILAGQLGQSEHLFQVPSGSSAADLYHQCH